MKRYEYDILRFDWRDKLVQVMNEKAKEGWEPVGGAFTIKHGEGEVIAWAIRKEIDEVEKY